MGGSIEAFRLFYGLESKKPMQPLQNAKDAYQTAMENNSSSSSAGDSATIRLKTPPIEADKAASAATSEFVNYGEEIVAAPTASQSIVAAPIPANIAKAFGPRNASEPIPSVADAEAGTVLTNLVSESSMSPGLTKSKILQSLSAGQEVAADSSIATAADVEAGTAMMEVVPDNAGKGRGESVSSTVSS